MTESTDLPSVLLKVRALARNEPARPALTFEGTIHTYEQLHARSNRVANGLLAAHLPKQSRIALLDLNDVAFAELFLGACKASHALCPINARLAPAEIAWIVNNAQAPIFFVGRDHYALVEQIESQLSARTIIALHGEHPRWLSYAQWLKRSDDRDPQLPFNLDDDIVQLYTSGTTGHPKGVCHTHRTWGHAGAAMRASNPAWFAADNVNLVCLPLFHVAAMDNLCFTLAGGGHVVLARRPDPKGILELLNAHSISIMSLVPALIPSVIDAAGANKAPPLKMLAYGASPISQNVLQRAREFFACSFEQIYGMTENLGVVTTLPAAMHDPALGKLRSCGRAHAGCELKIVDEQGREVATGEVGEIIMRAPWIMRCYWNNPQATANAVRDGWLWTGDAGYFDADGFLYIHDRVNDMIKSGGENVYPAEVENALYDYPAVAEAAVIGAPDARWGEIVKAVLVLKPGTALDPADIERHLRARIGAYKIPKSYEVVDALPRNASGKVLRRQLRERFSK